MLPSPLEAIAKSDANRQYEQANNFIARGVEGIIIAPVDAQTVKPMIKAANEANIPIAPTIAHLPPTMQVGCGGKRQLQPR
jgi:ABC-type xylose transport system substrate-binding protein